MFLFACYIYKYTYTCIHRSGSSSTGLHPFVEESLALSAEHHGPFSLEAVNLTSVTVSTKESLQDNSEKKNQNKSCDLEFCCIKQLITDVLMNFKISFTLKGNVVLEEKQTRTKYILYFIFRLGPVMVF